MQKLYQQDPAFAEALHSSLQFKENPTVSRTTNIFLERFEKQLFERLEGEETYQLLPPWRTLVGVALSLQIVVWIGGWWLPQYLVNQGSTVAEALQIPHSYRILYPAYLKRDSDVFSMLPNELRIPAGSRLEIFLEQGLPDGDQSAYRLIQGESQPLQWVPQQQRWRSALTPLKTGTLFLEWRQQSVAVEVIPDLSPTVRVLWPADRYIFDLSQLQVELEAKDDYGLQQILLRYRNESTGTIEHEIIQSFEGDFKIVDMIVANSESRVTVGAPTAFSLSEAYPNPFNPTTSMTLAVPESGVVSVQVYNVMGQVVATLASGYMDASTYNLTWDASNASSGMYFVKAEAAGSITTQKLVLMK